MAINKFLGGLILATVFAGTAGAADFFDKSAPENLFNLGVRLGVNTSNKNVNKNVFDTWNCNSWGTGIDVGVVADLNFRNWLSIQPGFFYESRSGKYSYISTSSLALDGPEYFAQYGRLRSYNFTVPILCSVHFNISDDVRWNVEAGPYLQFILKNSVSGDFSFPIYGENSALPITYSPINPSKFDFGLKFGSSLKILNHYLVGIHYEAGWLKPWKNANIGGRNKCWVFSIGYDL